MRVLLVEDDLRVAAVLAAALRRRGHEVVQALTAAEAVRAEPVDLILLDMNLPDRDGLEVCRRIRQLSEEVAIIAVTARGEEHDRVAGLRAGADDYVVKPFSMVELQARIEAVMRRTGRAAGAARVTAALQVGDLRVDVDARRVWLAGREVGLSRKEFDLLVVLARQAGTVVSRDRLQMEVWHTTWATRHNLDVHVAALRGKLDDAGLVETVRGVGYRLRAG
ncbi:DNA-binding response regulator [Micromonospora echinospora]|uniref:DNA-binding response regulator, OmpR family, contains REC and winged-helix (WHTH) domain n=1 Tax=Micromonospora echinospora TaxID=1877 RepID=A0A1C5A2B5_MICEC|nr:response regulator transcription factor [Micromonospora echinospora]OZV83712.1 DNA-binding response regulator [Micromonospora echinospora]SCF39362.1 DNA-binding response regulator, OmpR family, contains REC and winged-helix (wHTH) domain [Micromonospora echinospora]